MKPKSIAICALISCIYVVDVLASVVDDHASTTQTSTQSNRISARKCAEYAEAVYENVTISNGFNLPPIVRRVSTCSINSVPFILTETSRPKEFPHLALIGHQADPESPITYTCGGSLISESFVITAAHCINPNRIIGAVKYVMLGDSVFGRNEYHDSKSMVLNVAETIVHEGYKHSAKYNDIALIRLDRAVTFDQYIRPACLSETLSDVNAAVVFGMHQKEGPRAVKLTVRLSTKEDCAAAYEPFRNRMLKEGIKDEQQLCAITDGKNDCLHLSGGPIQIYHPHRHCMYTILGLTSFGMGCGETPEVYSRIDGYLDWIESHVWPNE